MRFEAIIPIILSVCLRQLMLPHSFFIFYLFYSACETSSSSLIWRAVRLLYILCHSQCCISNWRAFDPFDLVENVLPQHTFAALWLILANICDFVAYTNVNYWQFVRLSCASIGSKCAQILRLHDFDSVLFYYTNFIECNLYYGFDNSFFTDTNFMLISQGIIKTRK